MPEALPEGSAAWLGARAARDPAGTALQIGDQRLSWRALAADVETVAGRLGALGLARGDRVAVLMEPSRRLVEIVHAAQRSGLVGVLLNTRLVASELALLVAHAEPTLLLFDAAHGTLVADVRRSASVPAVEAQVGLDAVTSAPVPAPLAVDPQAVQTILYTSGTTGRPKGVMLTHGNHRASAAASRAHLGLQADDRWLCALPLHHVGGLSIVMRSVLDGTPLVLHERFDAAAVWAALGRERITSVSLVPTMLHRLLEHAAGAPPPPSLRCVLLGGAALTPELHARARATGWPVVPTYGLTEAASQVATAVVGAPGGCSTPPNSLGSVGRPLAGTRVRIVDPDAEGKGEVAISGPTVMAGYFRDPAATAAVLRDGWLYSGDVGRLDAAGDLQIFDRRTDLVITGGENVYPSEVEAVLVTHPAIADAAVYGVVDAEWGRRVQAAIVLRDAQPFDEAALRAWCRERLAAYKIPRRFVPMTTLPRTASGKLRRHVLAGS